MMDSSQVDMRVESNWNCSTQDKTLMDTLTITQGKQQENDLDFVTLDSCVCLQQSTEATPPQITIKSLRHNSSIITLDIAAEANLLEVYGTVEGYITTVKCELFDDFEGITVYNGHIVLPRCVNAVILKFPCYKPSTMWIFGIAVKATAGGPQPNKPPHTTNNPQLPSTISTMLTDMLQASGDSQNKSSSELTKLLGELSCNTDGNSLKSSNSDLLDEIKKYIDLKVDSAEKNVLRVLNERLSEIEEKQERNFSRVFEMLESREKSSDS